MMKNILMISLALSLTACGGFKAQRVDADKADEAAMKITDEWVSGDTIRVIDETMTKIDGHAKFKRFVSSRAGKEIKLFVGEIKNNTPEAYFPSEDLEEALLEKLSDDDRYTLIDARQREAILKEITYQNDGMVDPAQAKRIGRQSGADAMIFGTVNMNPKSRDGKTIKTYSINFRVTNLESGEELVRTRTQINKYSEQSSRGW